MFWDSVLDPIRRMLSNDISEWIVAAMLVALITTKLIGVMSGSTLGYRRELNVGIAIFVVLVGVFYLP
jgi:Flp pilus assembly protein protease CpaA